jgi:polyhydroxybutyrate depolymerase
MVNRLTRWLIYCALFLTAGVAYAQEATPELTPEATVEATPEPVFEFPGTGAFTVQSSDGTFDRQYRIYIPDSYAEANSPVPLLLVLHGAGGTGASIAQVTAFNDLADTHGFIVIYPDGYNRIWNDGRPPDPRVGPVDDVAYLADVIQSLQGALNIDPARVFATGYSAGGMMAFRLGCELPDMIAAIAPVATTFPQYLVSNCQGTPPLPVMIIQGTDDPVIPWVGYQGGYLSVGQSLEYWGNHNGCAETSPQILLPDVEASDGTLVVFESRADCSDDAEVQLYGIYHGGHTWPGHPLQAPFELGLTSLDIDATQVIWDFFSQYGE